MTARRTAHSALRTRTLRYDRRQSDARRWPAPRYHRRVPTSTDTEIEPLSVTAGVAAPSSTRLFAPTVLCYVVDPACRAAIDRLALSGLAIHPCNRLTDVPALARALAPSIIILEVSHHPTTEVIGLVAQTRSAVPTAYLIGVISYAVTSGDEIVAMVRAGLDSMSLRESGTLSSEIARGIRVVSQSGVLVRMTNQLGLLDALHPEAARVTRAAITAPAWPNVAIVARTLGCSQRELQRRFADAQLGRPHDLLQATRWILANAALRSTINGQKPVASTLGFSSVGAMRDAVRRSLSVPLEYISRDEIGRSLWEQLVDQFGLRVAG